MFLVITFDSTFHIDVNHTKKNRDTYFETHLINNLGCYEAPELSFFFRFKVNETFYYKRPNLELFIKNVHLSDLKLQLFIRIVQPRFQT